jgi:hypothetical protein
MGGAALGRPGVIAVARGGIVGLLLCCALALGGCETTAEESARLERAAKHAPLSAERGLRIAKRSPFVRVVATQVLHSGEQTAVVVTLRNVSAHALRDEPIAITVRDARRGVLFKNDAPGLEAALTSVALLPAGARTTWVDDQVQASGTPAGATALVGAAPAAPANVPRLRIGGVHTIDDPASGPGAAGTVADESTVAQHNLAVYALARRGGRIVAAGRAVLPELPAHGSSAFEVFFVGSPKGAKLQISAPPSSF